MTEEEKAEERAKEKYKDDNYTQCALKSTYKEGYIDGLKAGRPQWHDLRKDPNDLPRKTTSKFSIDVMTDMGEGYFLYESSSWFVWKYNGTVPVSRWCKIPQFKE